MVHPAAASAAAHVSPVPSPTRGTSVNLSSHGGEVDVEAAWAFLRDPAASCGNGAAAEELTALIESLGLEEKGDLLLLKGHAWSGNYGATGWRGGTHPCWRTSGKGDHILGNFGQASVKCRWRMQVFVPGNYSMEGPT